MAESLWSQIEYFVRVLKENGFDEEGERLEETLEFSTSSSELYFKTSGILKFFLSKNLCNDEIALKKLKNLDLEIDNLLK